MQSGVVFQDCNLTTMPSPNEAVLCLNEDGTADIGRLTYNKSLQMFVCKTINGELWNVVKWAKIQPMKQKASNSEILKIDAKKEAFLEATRQKFKGIAEDGAFIKGYMLAVEKIQKLVK